MEDKFQNKGNNYLKNLKKETEQFSTNKGEKYDIPIEGSLGLLALGAKGLIAWRRKRDSKK